MVSNAHVRQLTVSLKSFRVANFQLYVNGLSKMLKCFFFLQ